MDQSPRQGIDETARPLYSGPRLPLYRPASRPGRCVLQTTGRRSRGIQPEDDLRCWAADHVVAAGMQQPDELLALFWEGWLVEPWLRSGHADVPKHPARAYQAARTLVCSTMRSANGPRAAAARIGIAQGSPRSGRARPQRLRAGCGAPRPPRWSTRLRCARSRPSPRHRALAPRSSGESRCRTSRRTRSAGESRPRAVQASNIWSPTWSTSLARAYMPACGSGLAPKSPNNGFLQTILAAIALEDR